MLKCCHINFAWNMLYELIMNCIIFYLKKEQKLTYEVIFFWVSILCVKLTLILVAYKSYYLWLQTFQLSFCFFFVSYVSMKWFCCCLCIDFICELILIVQWFICRVCTHFFFLFLLLLFDFDGLGSVYFKVSFFFLILIVHFVSLWIGRKSIS